jgi:hypothetical protein
VTDYDDVAGVLGTLPPLFRLPARPPMVGRNVCTNTETLVGATARGLGTDYSHVVATTSSIAPSRRLVIQPVRYPRGSKPDERPSPLASTRIRS